VQNYTLISIMHIVCYIFLQKVCWSSRSIYVAMNLLKYHLCSCTMGNIACGCGLKTNIWHWALPHAILASRPCPCEIFPIVCSLYKFSPSISFLWFSHLLSCGHGTHPIYCLFVLLFCFTCLLFWVP